MVHMAGKHYIPSVVNYITKLSESVNQTKSACPGADVSVQQELIAEASRLLRQARDELRALSDALDRLAKMDTLHEMALFVSDVAVTHMDGLRAAVDALELIVDKDVWPVPTYGDLMFEV